MRWIAIACLFVAGTLVAGCGDSGGATTAGAGGVSTPPPPGGPPGGPPSGPPGGNPGAPGDYVPPSDAGNPPMPNPGDAAPPPTNDAPPADYVPPADPAGTPPPGEAANPNDGNPDGTPPPPPPPRGLREMAIAAFRNGNDDAGFKLLNAYYAVAPQAKNELAQKMGWVPGLSRPALAPRIGIAVQYLEVPMNWRGSPMPIGSQALTQAVDQMQQAEAQDQNIGATGRKNKFGVGRTGPIANFSESAKTDPTQNMNGPDQVNYYLGDFGDILLEALSERMETGEYGRVMQELVQQVPRQMPRPNRGNPGDPNALPGDGTPGDDGVNPGDGAPPPPGGQFPGGGRGRGRGQFGGGGRGQFGGGGRGQFGGGGRGQFGSGQFGGSGGLESILGGDNGSAPLGRWSSRLVKTKVDMSHVKPVMPCVLWLGKVDKDDREQVEKVADAVDVDILALFEMRVRQARTGSLINTTNTLKLINVKTKKPVGYVPEPLINLDVEKWRQKGAKGTDPVVKEISKAIEVLDKSLKPVELPEAVTAERAKKRITDLVSAKPDEPLPVLVEARYYCAKGLLSEQDYMDAAKELIGEDGYARLAAKAKEGD